MRYLLLVLFLPPMVLGAIGVRFTWRKLDKMEQLRGFKPAEDARTVTVLEKRRELKACWLRWADGAPITRPGAHRIWLSPERCEQHAVGDQLEVLFFEGDSEPYPVEDTVFASDGNFAFDRGILAVESAMIILPGLAALGVALLLRRRGAK